MIVVRLSRCSLVLVGVSGRVGGILVLLWVSVLSVGVCVGVGVSLFLVVRLSRCSFVLVGVRVRVGDLWCWCVYWC